MQGCILGFLKTPKNSWRRYYLYYTTQWCQPSSCVSLRKTADLFNSTRGRRVAVLRIVNISARAGA